MARRPSIVIMICLDLMDAMKPEAAWELGSVEFHIQNFTEWAVRSTFYVIPGSATDLFQWALVQLNWDDNYEIWCWEGLARIHCRRSPCPFTRQGSQCYGVCIWPQGKFSSRKKRRASLLGDKDGED